MKIWFGQGSEHSANLVMIGRFADIRAAKTFEESVRLIQEQVREEDSEGAMDWEHPRFSDEILRLLGERKAYSLVPAEVLQFALDYRLEARGTDVVITTDEIEVSALIKLMIDGGAKVEVYSAHDYPDTPKRNSAAD